jgi:hypothetical protein
VVAVGVDADARDWPCVVVVVVRVEVVVRGLPCVVCAGVVAAGACAAAWWPRCANAGEAVSAAITDIRATRRAVRMVTPPAPVAEQQECHRRPARVAPRTRARALRISRAKVQM